MAFGVAAPNYRLPTATRLGRVRLQVADLARSVAYYEGVLGFRTIDRQSHRVLLGTPDASPLVELVQRAGVRPVPRRGLLGLFHAAYLLPDRGHLARFLRHLEQERVPVGMSDHLVSEAIYLSDPDGLGIEVYADRPRDAWQSRAGQLVMTTEPLDVASLLREAGESAWNGVPPGTRVGHVHLHVGDLDVAEDFYHKALGLDKIVWSYPGALFLSAGGYHHHLGTNTWAAGEPPAGEGDARLLDWTLVLPSESDIDEASASLAAAGRAPDGEGRIADPWGTMLRLSAEL